MRAADQGMDLSDIRDLFEGRGRGRAGPHAEAAIILEQAQLRPEGERAAAVGGFGQANLRKLAQLDATA